MPSAVPPPHSPVAGSVRLILIAGVLLGAVLMSGLTYMLLSDRQMRLESAQRQSLTLMTGAERLLRLELRNLERAMLGIAADAEQLFRTVPDQAPTLLAGSIRGVLDRHAELESIVVVDARGRPLTAGRGAPTLPTWTAAKEGRGSVLHFGPLQNLGGHWLLPLAVPMGEGRWIVARLHTGELQNIVAGLDTGAEGTVQVVDRTGTILAYSRSTPPVVGRRFSDGPHAGAGGGFDVLERTSPIDGVKRIVATGALDDYPVAVSVGVSRQEVMAPWHLFAASAIVLYLLYWCGFAYLLHTVRRSGRAQSRLMEQLARSADSLRMAQRVGRTGTWALEEGSDRIDWSEQVSTILGLDPTQTSASSVAFCARLHPEDRARIATQFAQAWTSREPFAADCRIVRPDRDVRWVSIRGAAVIGDDGRVTLTGTVVDISERMRVQARLEDAERQFRLLFERNPLPFWVFDIETLRFLEVNHTAIAQYGYSREEFLAMTILDIRPPEHHDEVLRDIAVPRDGFDEVKVWLHCRKDGSPLEVRIYSADIEFGGRPARLVLAEDVTQHMAYQRELAYRASHDMTTGLLNVHALAERLAEEPAREYRIGYVQLRGLELIEDSLGREAGEEGLRTVARRLEELGERYGLVAHARGEEFVLAVRDPSRWTEALAALQAAVAQPVPGRDTLHQLEAWIGHAGYPVDGATAAQVIGNAALAAHAARADRVLLARFEYAMAREASQRLQLAGRIHRALDAEEFVLHFQVIRYAIDGTPAALEALLRWPRPDGGFVPPAEFIGMCEDSGLIVPLGRWALRQAARAQQQLSQAGLDRLPIAINVSLAQFLNSDLAADIEAALTEFGLRRGALHVELTESILLNRPGQAMNTLQRLQKQGVRISLDDFGTGFSSLSYLRHLPVDALKIDRSFVTDVETDERNASICRSLLALGHSLGLTVVAEGVETEAQYAWLRLHGCDQVQGYWFGKPAPLEQVVQRLLAPDDAARFSLRNATAGNSRQ